MIIELLAPASNGRPAPNGKLEISMAVIGAADGTGVSTEGDDADSRAELAARLITESSGFSVCSYPSGGTITL